jgi:sporulation protein YlmC with PRC-barrel domain
LRHRPQKFKQLLTMDIPVNAQVHCADGPCGRSTYVILNPYNAEVTHLVVQEKRFPHTAYLVPIDLVLETTPHLIQLRCSGDELTALEPFIRIEFVDSDMEPPMVDPYLEMEYPYPTWPYAIPETFRLPVEHAQIPPGEIAMHRGAHVRAIDGRVGTVDEFLVNPLNGHVTHLVLREGHLWGQKDVTIPVSEIDRIKEDTVYLKLDRHSVEALPAIPVRRRWS